MRIATITLLAALAATAAHAGKNEKETHADIGTCARFGEVYADKQVKETGNPAFRNLHFVLGYEKCMFVKGWDRVEIPAKVGY